MQLSREQTSGNVIRAWEAGRVRIGDRWIEGHVIVAADRIVADWDVLEPAGLEVEDLRPALEMQPEIILLGTGATRLMPDVALMSMLADRSIGLEIMSTPAACRTFNLLVHERRRVVAALFNT